MSSVRRTSLLLFFTVALVLLLPGQAQLTSAQVRALRWRGRSSPSSPRSGRPC